MKILLAAALMLLVPVAAIAEERITPQAAERLLRLMALDASLESVSREVQRAPEAIRGEVGAERFALAWDTAAEGRFDPEAMMDEIAADVAAALSPSQLATLEDFYADGLGARATALERAAEAPARDAVREAEDGAALERLATEEPARLQLIADAVEAMQIMPQGEALVLNMQIAFLRGMRVSGMIPLEMDDQTIVAMIQQRLPGIREELYATVLGGMAYAYQPLSDAELAAYLDFVTGPAGSALYLSVTRSTQGLFEREMWDLGAAMVEAAEL